MNIWDSIVEYYKTIGRNYNVNPIVFVGIHLVATPLFAVCVGWIIYNRKNKRSIMLPSLVAVFIFNAASIYLIIFGRGIPFYIYAIVGASAIISGYFTYKKIKKRITSIS